MRSRFRFDPWIVGSSLILLCFSIVVLRSVLPESTSQQLMFAVAAVATFFLFSQIDYQILAKFSRFFYLFACALLVVTFLFGRATRGSIRWIEIGSLTFQPSEFIKPVLILFLAEFVAKKRSLKTSNLLLFAALMSLPVVLVFIQPDLGSSLVLLIIGLSIAFAARTPLKAFIVILGVATVSLPLIFKFLKPYQQDRLRAFLNPYTDPLGSGYNVIQSMIAVGSGRLFGRGLGHGTQSQLRFLPERYSDFIFASLAEELGFMGAIIVLASYFILLFRLLLSVKKDLEPIGRFILIGVLSMLLFQVTVNIGMNLGLLPITGITLPLVSSGGSSLVTTMMSLGLAQSVIGRNKPTRTIEIR